LHGVLVHSDKPSKGNYFAFIKPHAESKWHKFDDVRVIPVTEREVLKSGTDGSTNAHMLVYVKESKEGEILAPITQADTPAHLSKYQINIPCFNFKYLCPLVPTGSESLLQKERKDHAQKTKEMEEKDLYLTAKVCSQSHHDISVQARYQFNNELL
jgi:hypothetical protein